MTTPTMHCLVPRELISPLKVLGKTEWLQITPARWLGDHHQFQFAGDLEQILARHPNFYVSLLGMAGKNDSLLLQFLAYSKLLASGPKIIQPTADQCEALSHVDLNLTFSEYEQPFPAFIVEIPSAYRASLSRQFDIECPRFVIPYHDRRTQFLAVLCASRAGSTVVTIMSHNHVDQSMENALRDRNDAHEDGPDFHQAAVIERIALNLALLLTRYGFQDGGPLNPKAVARQTQLAKRKSKRKSERARRLLDANLNRITLSQEVKFFRRVERVAQATGDGSKKSPHWRRGHFRRQRVGKDRCDSRLVFIPPTFINSDYFAGDLADTEYLIRTDGADLSNAL